MAKNSKSRLEAIEKVYNWYRSKLSKPNKVAAKSDKVIRNSKQAPVYIEEKKKVLNKVNRFFLPKIASEYSREEILDNINQKFLEMVSNEKLSFSSGESRNRIRKNATPVFQSNKREVSLDEERKFYSPISRTPTIFVEKTSDKPIFPMQKDFRASSHKHRILTNAIDHHHLSKKQFTNSRAVDEISKIKLKLAKRHLNISIANLESALSLHSQQINDSLTYLDLPKGGEFLIKGPLPQPKLLPTLKSQKTQKFSPK